MKSHMSLQPSGLSYYRAYQAYAVGSAPCSPTGGFWASRWARCSATLVQLCAMSTGCVPCITG